MKTIQFIVTVDVPDDENEEVVERRIDRMLENSYGYDVQVEPVEEN
jgi:hypothetical protein